MSRADLKMSVPEFTIVKAEAKAPHVAPAPSAFPKGSAIPELVGYPAETVYSAGSEQSCLYCWTCLTMPFVWLVHTHAMFEALPHLSAFCNECS